MSLPQELRPQEVKQKLDQGEKLLLLDVREPEEVAIVRIEGAKHIPMNDVPGRLHEIDPDADIVVFCHHGMRSANVADFLRHREFRSVANLSGGIDAWAAIVDPSLARY
jgi:rhodanese-related sulfurtransferase